MLSLRAPTFTFRAGRAVLAVRPRYFEVEGNVLAGSVAQGANVWVHVPGGAAEAEVVEIHHDEQLIPEAQAGQQVRLLLRGGRTLRFIGVDTGISDSPNYFAPPPPPAPEPRWQDYRGPEALAWLRQAPNGDDNAFASNRFHGTPGAIRFVESLYAAGASKVIVNEENIVDEGGGDLYADALVVLLPQDRAARARVVAICKPEADREDGVISSDEEWETGECVFLWWD